MGSVTGECLQGENDAEVGQVGQLDKLDRHIFKIVIIITYW